VTPTVSVVIPTHRRPQALRQTLAAVLAVDHPADALEVIVVDNAGDDATERVVAAFATERAAVRCERAPAGGAAAARNHGARAAGGELLVLLDDDILVERSHLTRHLQLRRQYGDCASGGDWRLSTETVAALQRTPFGRYRLALDRRYRAEEPGEPLDAERRQVPMLPACNLVLDRRRFRDIGGFDERFPYAGVEDRELSTRLDDAGVTLIRDASIRLIHNDQLLTLQQFCAREERNAATVAVLSRTHPGADRGRGFAAVNGPLSRSDPPGLIARKLVKSLLGAGPVSAAAFDGIAAISRFAPDPVLARSYEALIGAHIQRGFRSER
jgi:GT2 family glycosyltransferase